MVNLLEPDYTNARYGHIVHKPAFRVHSDPSHAQLIEHWYAPHTPYPRAPRNWQPINVKYSFDPVAGLTAALEVAEQFALKSPEITPSKIKRTYKGIGLTSRSGVDDPLYDAWRVTNDDDKVVDIDHIFRGYREDQPLEQQYATPVSEVSFDTETEAMHPFFREVVNRFQHQRTKVRLTKLEPGGILPTHVDFPYYKCVRLHAMLSTNPYVWFNVGGEKFHLPADGRFYWIDAGKHHAVWNLGDTPRYALSVNLLIYKDRHGNVLHQPDEPLFDILDRDDL